MKNWLVISWFDKSTIKHLRFPFSFFLMPVFLFALSQAEKVNPGHTVLAFIILHLFVFPSTNGYNSYQDKDVTSIGGLKHPPAVSRKLYYATLLFDILAVIMGFFVSVTFSLLVLAFILTSRAYSYRKIRLKKYPVIGFITVFIFQGAFVFLMAIIAITKVSLIGFFNLNNILCMAVSSLFIGSMYPLTQVYQHESDKNDGVISLSYKLGYHGTFIFSAVLFFIATILLFFYFKINNEPLMVGLFLLFNLPVIIHLSTWFNKVKKNTRNADYENTMKMNVLASAGMNLFFLVLIMHNQLNWL